MKKKQRRNSAIMTILSTIVLLVISALTIPFMYQVPDDKYLMQFASGQFTGKPSDYMIHIRFPISYLYSFLYKFISGVDWYGTIMIAIQLFCFSLLIYKILTKIEETKNKVLFLVLSYGIIASMWITEIVSITYTTSAAVLGLTAIVWYVISEQRIQDYVFCGVLMVICYNIRYETLYMVIPFAGVIWLYDFIMKKNKKAPIIFAMGVVIGLLSVISFDHYMYSSPEWKELFNYNQSRILLYDYYHDDLLNYEKYQDEYAKLGMTEVDRDIIESYDVTLKPELQTNIQELVKVHHEDRSFVQRFKEDIKKIIVDVILGNKLVTVITFIIWVLALWLIIAHKDKTRLYLSAGFIALQVMLWLYLGFRGRIMTRVSRSMMFLFSIMALLCVYYFWQDNKEQIHWDKIPRALIAGCCVVLAVTSVLSFAKQRKINVKSVNNSNYRDVEAYCNSNKDNFYFLDLYSISDYEGGYRYQFFNKNQYSNFVMLGDWMGYSPLFWKKLNNRGIENIQDAIFEKDNIFVIASYDKDISFIEKLRENVTCKVVDTIEGYEGRKYLVYQYRVN